MNKYSLEDLEAIRRLTHLYAYHIDHFEMEPLLALWTDDAVFDESGVGLRCSQGLDAIRNSFAEAFAVMDTVVHYTSNFLLLDCDGERARGTAYYLAEGVVKGGGTVHATGYYRDEYRKTVDGWRFRSREVFYFNPPDLGAYLAGANAL